ncbi:hypothetical protein B5K06_32100 [Rhizobium grahamii]|uniref:Uncharacterized protein n=1 Tax=Rhizobium grahamii TaxID=1120045 RepID=A0A370KG67_9HYPH|nr:hypothetical protein B5K06_32100 [Rhizobium grahamii]
MFLPSVLEPKRARPGLIGLYLTSITEAREWMGEVELMSGSPSLGLMFFPTITRIFLKMAR